MEPEIILSGTSGQGKAIIDALQSCGPSAIVRDHFPKYNNLPGVSVMLSANVQVKNYRDIVIRDIPDYAVVAGNPGKIIKYNEP